MNYAEQLSNIIKNEDLYGRSFTLGVALYIGVRNDSITTAFADDFEDICKEYYYDLDQQIERSGMHSSAKVWAELLDFAMLDDIARTLTGEDEEDEGEEE